MKDSRLRSLNANIRSVHTVKHGVHLLRSSHLLVVVLLEHTEVLLELRDVLLVWEDLFILIMQALYLYLAPFNALVELTISVIVPNEF